MCQPPMTADAPVPQKRLLAEKPKEKTGYLRREREARLALLPPRSHYCLVITPFIIKLYAELKSVDAPTFPLWSDRFLALATHHSASFVARWAVTAGRWRFRSRNSSDIRWRGTSPRGTPF